MAPHPNLSEVAEHIYVGRAAPLTVRTLAAVTTLTMPPRSRMGANECTAKLARPYVYTGAGHAASPPQSLAEAPPVKRRIPEVPPGLHAPPGG